MKGKITYWRIEMGIYRHMPIETWVKYINNFDWTEAFMHVINELYIHRLYDIFFIF